jgi:hypothetical protein
MGIRVRLCTHFPGSGEGMREEGDVCSETK